MTRYYVATLCPDSDARDAHYNFTLDEAVRFLASEKKYNKRARLIAGPMLDEHRAAPDRCIMELVATLTLAEFRRALRACAATVPATE